MKPFERGTLPPPPPPTAAPPERLGVVILNWNGREHLLNCLASLQACSPPADVIVVVDNGSTDGSPELVARHFPSVIVIKNDRNLGFARGNNQGSKAALERGCELVLILNNDTVVAPGALGFLRQAAQPSGVAIVNPLILDRGGNVWFSGATFKRWAGSIEHRHGPVPMRPVDIESATGCAMLIRAESVRQFGPFDERYFIYFEDSDLSASVRAQGNRIVLEPSAIIHHLISADSSKNAPSGFFYYLNTRNRLLFTRRHLSFTSWLGFVVVFTVADVGPRLVGLVALGRLGKARALAQGYADYFAGRFGPPPFFK